jgi:hypothetical protein
MEKQSVSDDRMAVTVGPDNRQLKCLICDKTEFRKRVRLLNTRWLTLFKLDWTNRSATIYVCSTCGFIHWFANTSGEALPR